MVNQDSQDEAALKIQSAYRGHMARKKYRPLINDRTGKLDAETAEFMKPFVYRWRKKSMYQVLLQYRAARYQDLVNLSQQVRLQIFSFKPSFMLFKCYLFCIIEFPFFFNF